MITIRQMKSQDVEKLANIWLETSIKAHYFIEEQYWNKNKTLMEEKYLPNSEVYIAEETNKDIYGFVALVENHIASIFVSSEHQGKGIGSLLLNYVKGLHKELLLNVYQKNEGSVNFYKSKGFDIIETTVDQPTGEKEFIMRWKSPVL